jgi:MIP family channel proteins
MGVKIGGRSAKRIEIKGVISLYSKFSGGEMFNPKVFVAEFIGTFALVFVGAAAGMYNVGLLGVALAHGLTLAVFAYAYGHISGTHINPAVTLGLATNGNIKWGDAVVYWAAQFSGAALAAFLLRMFVSLIDANALAATATAGVLTVDHPYYALAVEAILTFFLVNTVLHAAVDGKAGPLAGLAIGLTLTVAILAGGPLTGASLNPARSFGPALFNITNDTPDYLNPMLYLVYFVGPFVGAILAVLVYQLFKYEPAELEEFEEVEVAEEAIEEPEIVEPVKKTARKPAVRKTDK